MTDKSKAQKAFKEVEAELEEKQVKELKEIVRKYLTKLELKKDEKAKVDKDIKILKSDIEDLKEGRLDRIKERQEKDPVAREVSVIIIKEKITKEVPVWRTPYTWVYNEQYVYPEVLYDGSAGYIGLATTTTTNCEMPTNFTTNVLNSNVAKNNTKGTYNVGEDHIVYLR